MEKKVTDVDLEKNLRLKEQVGRLLRSERLLYETQINLDQQLRRITLINDFILSVSKAQSLDQILLASLELLASIYVFQNSVVLLFDNANKKLIVKAKSSQGSKPTPTNLNLDYLSSQSLNLTKNFGIILATPDNKNALIDFARDVFTRSFNAKIVFESESELFFILNEDKNNDCYHLFLFLCPPQRNVAYTERIPSFSDASFINLLSKNLNSAIKSHVYQEQLLNFANQLENKVTLRTQELSESREKYRSIVDASTDLIWVLDKTGKIVEISPGVEKLLGYKPEEVIGKSPLGYMPPNVAKKR
ncbi:MAG: PAS domain S-box protein, partial [Gammaproteobacteria bacterium]|nr:PAS domain S-box protein [Gammaproteobacteria bacterium]